MRSASCCATPTRPRPWAVGPGSSSSPTPTSATVSLGWRRFFKGWWMAVVLDDVVAERLDGLRDERVSPKLWGQLLERGAHHVFLEREWLQAWRRWYGRGELMLVLVSRG